MGNKVDLEDQRQVSAKRGEKVIRVLLYHVVDDSFGNGFGLAELPILIVV